MGTRLEQKTLALTNGKNQCLGAQRVWYFWRVDKRPTGHQFTTEKMLRSSAQGSPVLKTSVNTHNLPMSLRFHSYDPGTEEIPEA